MVLRAVHAAGGPIAAIALPGSPSKAGDGGHIIHAAALLSLHLAADIEAIALAHLEGGRGDDRALIRPGVLPGKLVLAGVVGKGHLAVLIAQDDRIAGLPGGAELKVHHRLNRVGAFIVLRPVHGRAQGHHHTAVDERAAVRVQARVRGQVRRADHRARVDRQEAVGVHAVPFRPQTGTDVEGPSVDGQDADAVFVDIDAVILRGDVHRAAVDRQMKLGVQALVAAGDLQHAGACLLPGDVHGLVGVERAVHLPRLLLGRVRICSVLVFVLGLQDPEHIGAVDGVYRAVGQDHVGAGVGSVHLVAEFCPILPGVVALIHIGKHHAGGYGAGDVHTVQDQGHLTGRVVKGFLSQIHPDLAVPGAGEPVGPGLGDMEDGVGIRLLLGVHHLGGKAGTQGRKSGEDEFFIPWGLIHIDPLGLPIVAHLLELLLVQLRVVDDVVGDIGQVLPGGGGAGVVLRRRVLHLPMVGGGIGVPHIVIFRQGLAVQGGGVGVAVLRFLGGQNDLINGRILRRHGRRGKAHHQRKAQQQSNGSFHVASFLSLP